MVIGIGTYIDQTCYIFRFMFLHDLNLFTENSKINLYIEFHLVLLIFELKFGCNNDMIHSKCILIYNKHIYYIPLSIRYIEIYYVSTQYTINLSIKWYIKYETWNLSIYVFTAKSIPSTNSFSADHEIFYVLRKEMI